MPHRARSEHKAAHPVHATMRATGGLRLLRTAPVFASLKASIAEASSLEFRIIHFSVQHDHIHFIVEARDTTTLASGMRGLAIRLARAVNRALRRRGRVWKERYHTRELTRPREVRNSLLYVLMNHKKHRTSAAWLDPRSSAAWFDGWRKDALFEHALRDLHELAGQTSPVRPPRTWLAREGWRRYRLLGVDEAPLEKSAPAQPKFTA